MAELKLFKVNGHVEELKSKSVTIEKELQNIIEKNMQEFFGVRFLASEYRIDNGRMDSIGIDENNCPVIFEYKRFSSENVINQGLFYLNWLLEHRANFKLLVLETYGNEVANNIDWSSETALNSLKEAMSILRDCYNNDKRKIYHSQKFAEFAIILQEKHNCKDFIEDAKKWILETIQEQGENISKKTKELKARLDKI